MWSRKTKRNELIFLLSLFSLVAYIYNLHIYDKVEKIIIIFCLLFQILFWLRVACNRNYEEKSRIYGNPRDNQKKNNFRKKTEKKNMSMTQSIEWSRFFYRGQITDKNNGGFDVSDGAT